MKRILLFAVVMTFLLSTSCFCQENLSLSDILSQIQSVSQEIKTYSANFDMQMGKGQEALKFKGNVKCKSPNKVKMELNLTSPKKAKQLTINDGQTVWKYIPEEKVVYKQQVNLPSTKNASLNMDGNLKNPFKDIQEGTLKYLGRDKIDETTVYVFEGSVKKELSAQQAYILDTAKVYVGVKDGLLRRFVIYTVKKDIAMFEEFKDIKIDIDIPNEEFTFSPTSDVQVIEQ